MGGLPTQQPVSQPDQSSVAVPADAGQPQSPGGEERGQVIADPGQVRAACTEVTDPTQSGEDSIGCKDRAQQRRTAVQFQTPQRLYNKHSITQHITLIDPWSHKRS